MIGKPEWFTYRVIGWGLRPRTREGWAYVGILLTLLALIAALPIPETPKLWLGGSLLALAGLDGIHIMSRLGEQHDERERFHQLIVERNSSFAALAALLGVVAVQTWHRRHLPGTWLPCDASILVVLSVMTVTKFLSSLYVRWRR